MNLPSESNHYESDPNTPILEGEILAESEYSEQNSLDLDLIFLDPEPLDSEDTTPSVFLKLTPWGLGAIALFLFSNLLLTWAQFSKDSLAEMGQNPLEMLPISEINSPSPLEVQPSLDPNDLSTLPEESQPSPPPVPPAPPVTSKPSTPQQSPNSSLPTQPNLSEKLLPPTLRPQSIPVTQRQRISSPPSQPRTFVPTASPRQTALPQPQNIPAPPSPYHSSIEPPVVPNPPELSKDDQLRNILRQQIVREEGNREPEQSFNQRIRQKMLDAKMREFRAAQEAQAAQQAQQAQQATSTANNGVTPPPPPPQRSQTSAPIPPAPSVAPQPTQAKPRNVNDLVNTLESFNQN